MLLIQKTSEFVKVIKYLVLNISNLVENVLIFEKFYKYCIIGNNTKSKKS